MIYKAPKINNKVYWIPIVVKNKDYLMGYIIGSRTVENIIVDSLNNAGIMNLDNLDLDLCLDSSRFNDVLENDKRESELSKNEIKEYYEKLVLKKFNKFENSHPDNNINLFDDYFLTVECPCNLGVYSFKTLEDIPDKRFKCIECGRILIDYTGHDDYEYEFDGKI